MATRCFYVNRRATIQIMVILISVLFMSMWSSPSAFAGGTWNDAGIDWQSYEQGLVKAKRELKPVCIIFYTEWCPHCTNYSKLFHDPKVVKKAKQFVMIRIDRDKHPELSKKYSPDGEYIPRTFFLSPTGKLYPTIHPKRDRYIYFYNEHKPEALLSGMGQALEKLR